jgi:hypothetical protein
MLKVNSFSFNIVSHMIHEAGCGLGVGGRETKAEMEADVFLFACPENLLVGPKLTRI